jgi:hypothetical protein
MDFWPKQLNKTSRNGGCVEGLEANIVMMRFFSIFICIFVSFLIKISPRVF